MWGSRVGSSRSGAGRRISAPCGRGAGAELVHPPAVEGRWRRTPARPDPVHGRRDGAACGRGVKRDGRCCCTEKLRRSAQQPCGPGAGGPRSRGAGPAVGAGRSRTGRPVPIGSVGRATGRRPPTITVTRGDGGAGRGSSAPPPYPAAMIASNSNLSFSRSTTPSDVTSAGWSCISRSSGANATVAGAVGSGAVVVGDMVNTGSSDRDLGTVVEGHSGRGAQRSRRTEVEHDGRGQASICLALFCSLALIEILRGLAFSAIGMRRVNTPAS